jgi:hypothetical protein
MTSRWLAALHALLAGAQAVTAGAALADYVGARPAGLAALMVAGLQVALAVYTDRTASTPADPVPLLRSQQ